MKRKDWRDNNNDQGIVFYFCPGCHRGKEDCACCQKCWKPKESTVLNVGAELCVCDINLDTQYVGRMWGSDIIETSQVNNNPQAELYGQALRDAVGLPDGVEMRQANTYRGEIVNPTIHARSLNGVPIRLEGPVSDLTTEQARQIREALGIPDNIAGRVANERARVEQSMIAQGRTITLEEAARRIRTNIEPYPGFMSEAQGIIENEDPTNGNNE